LVTLYIPWTTTRKIALLSCTHQVVDVLGKIRGQTLGLEDAEDLVAGDEADLGDSVAVSEDDSDLGRGHALLGQLEDLVGKKRTKNWGPAFEMLPI
jgi:hypothetical protein